MHYFIAFLALTTGCTMETPVDPTTGAYHEGTDQEEAGPGDEAWANEDVTCSGHADCLTGESCLNNVCQPSQCEGGLAESAAPLGSTYSFFADNEIGIADKNPDGDGSYWVDTYSPYATSTSYESSTEMSNNRMVDISGGRFEKVQKARYVAAVEGRNAIGFSDTGGTDWVTLGYQPAAIDAGDTDVDGLDEVVAIDADGTVSACSMDSNTCTSWTFEDMEGLEIIDVGVGDVDGDAVSEIALLIALGDDQLIYVLNHDYEEKDQPASYQQYIQSASRIDVGDLDGDRMAEVIVLRDINDWPIMGEDDALDVYTIADSATDEEVGELSMLAWIDTKDLQNLVDIEVADTDADTLSEIFVIDEDEIIAAYDFMAGELGIRYKEELDMGTTPHRLALADTDGDSPQATLMDGPTLAKGAPIPGALVLMPPYDADHSAGPAGSFYGSGESTSEEYSDSIYLGMSVDMGIKLEFVPAFGASFNSSVSWRVSQTHGERTRRYVGGRFGMESDPEMYGPYHGAVVLHWGCFDTYTYEIYDPSGFATDLDGENFVLTVPVGGSVSVWSVSRYNAMAEAIGNLPIIEVPYAVGDVDDYPSEPERLDGTAIPDEDMVFSEELWYTAPDVGRVSFWRSLGQESTQRVSWDTRMGTSMDVTAAGVKVGVGAEFGWGKGYSLTLGTGALFAGSVDAIPDDPETPEDEYNLFTYRFAPIVYREWYTNQNGDDAAFYVMSYVAER